MPPVQDEAICIRQWDWSETSQTVSLFTREHGLVRALAKGARRPKAPFSGGIEVLTRGRLGIIAKQSSEMALLTEWDFAEQFPALRRSLPAHHAGLYMAELILHAVHDHDPHPALYDTFLESLRALENPASLHPALLNFQWGLLVETGYRPQVARDVRTEAELPEANAYRFSPALGGVLPDDPTSPQASSAWRVRAETIALLRRLPIKIDDAPPPTPPTADAPSAPAVLRAGRLLAAYLRYVLGREPRMLPYLYDRQLPR